MTHTIAVQCQVCGKVTAHVGHVDDLTQVRCPECGVAARLVQVPFGKLKDGRPKPGMPVTPYTIPTASRSP